ncbi:MAG: DUF4114 domain-containing protein [Myxococcales bacterium]|nr:DUF4114 domain-containing protein [Myxococcales bacterium]
MRGRHLSGLTFGLFVLAAAPGALALQQPNGITIPVLNAGVTTCSDKNVQVCLNAEEGGATINALTAAAVTPETYTPICSLTFKVIARGAGYLNTFGWYNVVAGQKPPASDLHSFLECGDGPGTVKVLNIKSSPYYKGGEVGFFMASPEGASGNCPKFNAAGGPVAGTVGYIYYSERKYNPDNTGANSWVHLITYNSVAHKNAFYFGWEDLLSGGDNDFDDLLTRVDGIQCTGGGAPCTVAGKQGKCASGIMQCQNGQLTCVQTWQPTTESCNALDDDCNGQTDDGDLCPPSQICHKGKCVPKCGTTEFQCVGGLKCKDGLCIDAACETVDCKSGEVCVGGKCQGACDGVTCPFGQKCVEGVCSDPCASVKCDSDFVCVGGVCQVKCSCEPCASGKECVTATGKCEDTGCGSQSCAAGTHCVAGACVDDCQGAVCPKGQLCTAGQCTVDTDAGAGTGGSSGDGGIVIGGSGGGSAAGGGAGGKDGGAQAGTGNLPGTTPAENEGCGCRTAGGPASAGLSALVVLGLFAGRRRRASRSSR